MPVRSRPSIFALLARPPKPLLVSVLVVLAGCGGEGNLTLDEVDPGAVPADPTYDQVYAILQLRCASCHAGEEELVMTVGSTPTRAEEDDGEDLDLENCVEIVAQRDGILERIDDDSMPPGAMPRLTSEQKLLIRRWVEDGAPAPCN